eukprot:scaffold4_cov396-Prasinococcus_capsulatus_cf.AAC.5
MAAAAPVARCSCTTAKVSGAARGRSWSVRRADCRRRCARDRQQTDDQWRRRAPSASDASAGLSEETACKSLQVQGDGTYLGLPADDWSLQWDATGVSFLETIRIPKHDLCWREACTHEPSRGTLGDGLVAWSEDYAGLVVELELEDRDTSLLAGWIHTGQYHNRRVQSLLSLQQLDSNALQQASSSTSPTAEQLAFLKLEAKHAEVTLEGSGKEVPISDCHTVVRVSLKRSALVFGLLLLDTKGRATHFAIETASGTQLWAYRGWTSLTLSDSAGGAAFFATEMDHALGAGGVNSFRVRDECRDGDCIRAATRVFASPLVANEALYNLQLSTALRDTSTEFSFDSTLPNVVKSAKGEGGHILLQGSVNDGEPLWFVLDTGASGRRPIMLCSQQNALFSQ